MKRDFVQMDVQPTDSLGSAILLRYLDGGASPAETRLIEEWLARDARHRKDLNRLQDAWEVAARGYRPAFDYEELWSRIQQGIVADAVEAAPVVAASAADDTTAENRPQPLYMQSTRKRAGSASRWWGRTAIAGLLAAAAAVVMVVIADPSGPEANSATEPEIAMTTYTTRPGQIGRITFPDGTKVILGGASTLEAPANWKTGMTGEVYLDGQAYFEVAPGSTNGLRVHTERVIAEDLGTTFAVIAYARDSVHQVAVSEGIVSISGAQVATPVVLNANDVAHIPSTGAVSTSRNVSVDRYFGWVNGQLNFDQERVADAIQMIERHFGVEVRVADPALLQKRFTGTIRSATLFDDLSGLASLLDARYQRADRIVTLTPE